MNKKYPQTEIMWKHVKNICVSVKYLQLSILKVLAKCQTLSPTGITCVIHQEHNKNLKHLNTQNASCKTFHTNIFIMHSFIKLRITSHLVLSNITRKKWFKTQMWSYEHKVNLLFSLSRRKIDFKMAKGA